MVTYLPRSAWGARASRGSTALVASQVTGDVLHWPGMAKPIDAAGDIGKRRVASALRGWQNYHMDNRGWSDIAYQIAVDQAGRAWTLRGLNIRSGANGDATVNRQYGAVLLVLAPGEQPSAAMKATTRGVIADFRKRFPKGTAIKPHSAVREAGTDCPGSAARAAIARGDFTPGSTTPPPTEEIDVAAKDEILDYLEACTIQIQNHNDQVLRAAVVAIQNNIDAVDDEVWSKQIADVSTPESGDTAAAATLLTHASNRGAERAVELLQPQLDSLKAAVEALGAALPKA